jgi:hypothetical protein
MTGNNAVAAFVKGTSRLVRPRFSPGLLLRDDDLRQAVEYTRELNRLMFRSLFGCGVVCGLDVETAYACGKLTVTVADGVALDCHGDPIHVPDKQQLVFDTECASDAPTKLWVVIRHLDKCCAPRTTMCSSEEDETPSVCTREKDGYEIRLVKDKPECACWCPEGYQRSPNTPCQCVDPNQLCYKDHYDGKCGCACGDCSDCDCEWLVLAQLDYQERGGEEKDDKWNADHTFRRFVRPVLMRDPHTVPEFQVKRSLKAEAGPALAERLPPGDEPLEKDYSALRKTKKT